MKYGQRRYLLVLRYVLRTEHGVGTLFPTHGIQVFRYRTSHFNNRVTVDNLENLARYFIGPCVAPEC